MAATDPMSEPPLCVCGHPRNDHFQNEPPYGCIRDECWKEGNRCQAFRPALDWPDEAGNYWLDRCHCPVHFIVAPDFPWIDGLHIAGAHYHRADFEALYGRDARFTKCEPNPFTERKVTE